MVSAASGVKRLRSIVVSKLRSIFAVIVVGASMCVGGVAAHAAGPVGAPLSQIGHLSQADVSSTTQPPATGADDTAATTAEPTSRRSANGTTRRVTIGLLAIAASTAVMALIFFWYTIPSRRQRIYERDR